MRIFLLGASGGTGREIAAQALARGHQVTALVREPARLPLRDPGLRTVLGDLLVDQRAALDALGGHDAVVSALGVRNSFRSGRLIERGLGAVVPAAERADVRRFVLISAFGVGHTRRDASLPQRLIYRVLLAGIYADKLAGERLLAGSALDWTVIYPVLLTDGPATGSYRLATTLPMKGVPKIARADVAHAVLEELAANRFVRSGAVISG